MVYAADVLRINWLFATSDGQEEAQTGLMLTIPSLTTWRDAVTTDPTIGTAFGNEMATLLGTSSGNVFRFPTWARQTGIEFQFLNPDGSYAFDAVRQPYGPVSGLKADTYPQQTVCLSLWSGSNLGEANHGRMYLPYTRMVQDTASYAVAPATTAAAAAAAKTFLQQVNTTADLVDAGSAIRIASKKGAGTFKTPAFVRVGNLVDTQRRRRNQVGETYATEAL